MNITKNLVKPLLIGSVSLAAAFGSAAWADQSRAANGNAADQISAKYDAAKKHCDTLSGNDKDVCEQKAKAQRDSAKADVKADKKTAEARHDAADEKRDAAYKVDKEKCDAMSGDAKDQCVAQAKTKHGK